jgi:hypothetical protein
MGNLLSPQQWHSLTGPLPAAELDDLWDRLGVPELLRRLYAGSVAVPVGGPDDDALPISVSPGVGPGPRAGPGHA